MFRADTDIEYFTTTKRAVLNIDNNDQIWNSAEDSGGLLSLVELDY